MNYGAQMPTWPRLTTMLVSCLFAFCAAVPGAGAAEDDAFDQLMARLGQRSHGHVTFTERHITSVLDRPVEASGELLYDAPDRLEKRTLKPRPERLVLEHGMLTIERGHREHQVALADYPQVAPYIDSIRAVLAGDRLALEHAFRIEFSNSGSEWDLVLLPLNAQVATEFASIRIAGTGDIIRTVTTQLANGDRSIMTLGTPDP